MAAIICSVADDLESDEDDFEDIFTVARSIVMYVCEI